MRRFLAGVRAQTSIAPPFPLVDRVSKFVNNNFKQVYKKVSNDLLGRILLMFDVILTNRQYTVDITAKTFNLLKII